MLKQSLVALVALMALGLLVFLLLADDSVRELAASTPAEAPAATQETVDLVRPELEATGRTETTVPEPTASVQLEEPSVLPDLYLSGHDGILTVTVVDTAGAPIQGARVQLIPPPSQPPSTVQEPDAELMRTWAERRARLISIEVRTDVTGRAVLEGLPMRRWGATVSLDGWAPRRSGRVALTEKRPERHVEVVLRAVGHVLGHLKSIRGEPVQGFRIFIQHELLEPVIPREPTASTTTDSNGAFEFRDLPVGTWTLRTDPRMQGAWEPQDHVLAQEVEVEVRGGETTYVNLPRNSDMIVRLFGQVVRNGAPMVGAGVFAKLMGPRFMIAGPSGTTDGEGRFELFLEQGGIWNFNVSAGRGKSRASQAVTIPQTPRHEVVLGFSTGNLSGRVLSPTGEAVGGASVAAHTPRAARAVAGASGSGFTASDAGGRYEFVDLPVGPYVIQAQPPKQARGDDSSPPGGVAQSEVVTLEAGKTLSGVDVYLSTTSGSVQGRVLDENGDAVSRAFVELRSQRTKNKGPSLEEGLYSIKDVEEGTCWVRATRRDQTSHWMSAVVNADTVTTLDLVLVPGATVVVELEDGDGPVKEGSVSLQSGEKRIALDMPVRDGKARIRAVPPGIYRVVARGSWRDREKPTAEATITVVGGEEQVVQLRLP